MMAFYRGTVQRAPARTAVNGAIRSEFHLMVALFGQNYGR